VRRVRCGRWEQALVLRQLERRFGPLDEGTRERVDQAAIQDL
jgi:hypothetical protein